MSTQKWFEREPLEMRDAVAVIVGGKTLKLTGSGGDADFLNRANRHFNPGCPAFPSGTWVATCVHKNGRRVEIPIAKRVDNKFVALPGVAWIYPPTKSNPQQVMEAGL